MNITLVQPPTKNWTLIAEQLDDPSTWDRFAPTHTAYSQRWRFDSTVKEKAAGNGVLLKPCKDLVARGVSAFEYDWSTDEAAILSHAMEVAEMLGLQLMVGISNEPAPHAA